MTMAPHKEPPLFLAIYDHRKNDEVDVTRLKRFKQRLLSSVKCVPTLMQQIMKRG